MLVKSKMKFRQGGAMNMSNMKHMTMMKAMNTNRNKSMTGDPRRDPDTVRQLEGGSPTITDPNNPPAQGGIGFAEQNLDNFSQTPNVFGVDRSSEFGKSFGGLSRDGQREAFSQNFQIPNPYRSQEGQNEFNTISELNALNDSGQLQRNLSEFGFEGTADEFLRQQSDAGQDRLRRFSTRDSGFPNALNQDTIEGIRTRNASPVAINRQGGKFTIMKRFAKGGNLNIDAANQF